MATNTVDKPAASTGGTNPTCNACGEEIVSSTVVQKTACNHIFHKSCLDVCIKSRPFCPICNARISAESQTQNKSQYKTRSHSRAATNPSAEDNIAIQSVENIPAPAEIPSITSTERIQELVTNTVAAQLSTFGAQMSDLIERNIAASMARLMPNTSPRNLPRQPITSPHQMQNYLLLRIELLGSCSELPPTMNKIVQPRADLLKIM